MDNFGTDTTPAKTYGRKLMSEMLIPLGILVLWYVMNAWILPWFGVQT